MPLSRTYLLVTDSHTDNVVFRFDGLTGAPARTIKVASPAPGGWMPYGLARDRFGTPYVSIRNSGRILRYRPETDMFVGFTTTPDGGGFGLSYRTTVNVRNQGSRFYLCTREGVRMFSGSKGIDLGYLVSPGSGGLGTTVVSSFGPDGNFYVGEYSGRVLRYDGKTGAFIDVFVGDGNLGFQLLDGMAFGPDGNLYTVSSEHEKILKYDGTTGAFIGEFVPYVDLPSGIRFGPDGHLYVCSVRSIKRFHGQTGAFIDDFVQGGGLYLPNDLEFVEMPAPIPQFAIWQNVPRWLQVIGVGLLIGLVANLLQQPRVGNRFRR